VEELADGHLVTGGRREVWDRIQQRERSPFAATPAAGMEEQPALSSLIGADLRHFAQANERVVHVPAEAHSEDSDAAGEDEPGREAVAVEEPPAAEPKDAAAQWGRPKN
jgi:hypothetical protein